MCDMLGMGQGWAPVVGHTLNTVPGNLQPWGLWGLHGFVCVYVW